MCSSDLSLVIKPRKDELHQKLYTCKYGLTIEITNLKEDWTQVDVEQVQRHLGALQIPKFLRSTEKNVFNTEVKTDGCNMENRSEERGVGKVCRARWSLYH